MLTSNLWFSFDLLSCLLQGLYQKAEALYTMGDFEFALVYYHRGHKLRPELQEFRLGIQKAQEAIDNSVGSKSLDTTWGETRRSYFGYTAKRFSYFIKDFKTHIHLSLPILKGPSSVKLENKGDLSVFHKSNGVSSLSLSLSPSPYTTCPVTHPTFVYILPLPVSNAYLFVWYNPKGSSQAF